MATGENQKGSANHTGPREQTEETTSQATDDEFSCSPMDWEEWLDGESHSSHTDDISDDHCN